MIKTVWVKNQNGQYLELELRKSGEDVGLLVFNLTGLGSPVATVNGVGGPSFDGIVVNSVRADSRHMILTLAVQGSGVIEEEAKRIIYQFFPDKEKITLGIRTDAGADVYIEAYVESNEFPQFAKVENAAISLLAPMPYFSDVSIRTSNITWETGIPTFEFPFSNESLIDSLIELGQVTYSIPTSIINYTGVTTGCDISITFSDYVHGISIGNSNGGQKMTLDLDHIEAIIGSDVQAGDQIVINTRIGKKSVEFVREGVRYNAINSIGIDDDWLELRPGKNLIVIRAEIGEEDLEADIQFSPLRGGI